MEILSRISEILTTITQESNATLMNVCEENNLNQERGDIPLKEALINLSQVKDILEDAIANSKLNQLPLSIQKTLLANLENIKSIQVNLIAGSDEVVNLVNSIETIYANTWSFGFHHLSDQLLGYTTKMNQLKDQEVRI